MISFERLKRTVSETEKRNIKYTHQQWPNIQHQHVRTYYTKQFLEDMDCFMIQGQNLAFELTLCGIPTAKFHPLESEEMWPPTIAISAIYTYIHLIHQIGILISNISMMNRIRERRRRKKKTFFFSVPSTCEFIYYFYA